MDYTDVEPAAVRPFLNGKNRGQHGFLKAPCSRVARQLVHAKITFLRLRRCAAFKCVHDWVCASVV